MKTVIFVSNSHFFLSGLCLKYLANVKEVTDTTIITPNVEKLKEFHKWLGFSNLSYLSDQHISSVLQIDKIDILSKQYAVLNLDRIIDSDYIFNVDADVIFNKSISLFYNNKTIFYLENEYYEPYFRTIRDIFGIEKILDNSVSFIADFMLLESNKLVTMRSTCSPLKDYQLLKSIVDKNTPVTEPRSYPAFSEYETYGTWMMYNDISNMKLINSHTFSNSGMFTNFQPTIQNLNVNPYILPLRITRDKDIDWNKIYSPDWVKFK